MEKLALLSKATPQHWRAGLQFISVALLILVCGCRTGSDSPAKSESDARLKSPRNGSPAWRGVHLLVESDEQAVALTAELPKLAAVGVNAVIVEVDYNFEFDSHPELRSGRFVTKAHAHELTQKARPLGIRVIPQINCLGHQSWSKNTLSLLTKYPQLDETPGQFPDNKGIYCRSWCPQNPEVNPIIFALIDDLVDAFEADAFHVGMDEVFIVADEHCPRCRGGDPAKLFAKTVNDLRDHIVGRRKLGMLMWGDRLLDAGTMGYGVWESSTNGTAGAVDLIPKDIIVCDWHYEKRTNYPSVPFLLEKGFRVWPSGWQPLPATKAFSAFAQQQGNPRVVGYLCTTWGSARIPTAAAWPPIVETLREWK